MDAPVKPEWLADMSVLTLAPGDVLVIRSKHTLTTQAHVQIHESVRLLTARIGFPVPVLVVEEDLGIGVLRPAPVAPS